MSRNEDLSQFDPTAEVPEAKFDPILQDVRVVNNKLLSEMSNGQITDLGNFKLASAAHVVGGYINPAGRAVIQLSDGNEVVLNKITNDKEYQVTLGGEGYFIGNDKSKLQFVPVETNFPLTFDGKTFDINVESNSLRLDKYFRADHVGPAAAGRTYTSWASIRLDRIFNNLGLEVNGNIIKLPAGTYYVKITGQHVRCSTTWMALINSANNTPIHSHYPVSSSYGSTTGAALLLFSNKITLSEDTNVYLGYYSSYANTENWAMGVTPNPLDVNHISDIYNTLQLWRLND